MGNYCFCFAYPIIDLDIQNEHGRRTRLIKPVDLILDSGILCRVFGNYNLALPHWIKPIFQSESQVCLFAELPRK